MEKILAIDDDRQILKIIKEMLTKEKYEVETKQYIENFNIETFEGYDLILLDITLPYFNGFEILEKIKSIINCPVIFISAQSTEEAKVKGLMLGADDYISKPFSIRELAARIKVVLKRNSRNTKNKIIFKDMEFDLQTNSISFTDDEGLIVLTRSEFRICKILVQNKDQIFPKDVLYDYLYDLEADTQLRTITEYVYSIRKKFKQFGRNPIKTIWGVGYKWCEN